MNRQYIKLIYKDYNNAIIERNRVKKRIVKNLEKYTKLNNPDNQLLTDKEIMNKQELKKTIILLSLLKSELSMELKSLDSIITKLKKDEYANNPKHINVVDLSAWCLNNRKSDHGNSLQ